MTSDSIVRRNRGFAPIILRQNDEPINYPSGFSAAGGPTVLGWPPLVWPTMANSAGTTVDGIDVGENDGTTGVTGGGPRNPLICGVCHDYYNEPCLLSCFHTFCARCIRGPHLEGKVSCPICG